MKMNEKLLWYNWIFKHSLIFFLPTIICLDILVTSLPPITYLIFFSKFYQDLKKISKHKLEPMTPTTNAKRIAPDGSSDSTTLKDHCDGNLSSTKVNKPLKMDHIKTYKTLPLPRIFRIFIPIKCNWPMFQNNILKFIYFKHFFTTHLFPLQINISHSNTRTYTEISLSQIFGSRKKIGSFTTIVVQSIVSHFDIICYVF